jgi:hypothetical protein
MDYEYDIFISYKRGTDCEDWVRKTFKPLLIKVIRDYYLGEGDPKIFIDEEGLEVGMDWPLKLKRALARSKCMLAIWSPSYFRRSAWCVIEYSVMKHRQEQLGLGPNEAPFSLIWPVLFRKLDPVPPFVMNTEFLDLSDFNSLLSEDSNLQKYSEFKEKFESKIVSLARIIANAPPWSKEWETSAWLEAPFQNIQKALQEYKQSLPSWAL